MFNPSKYIITLILLSNLFYLLPSYSQNAKQLKIIGDYYDNHYYLNLFDEWTKKTEPFENNFDKNSDVQKEEGWLFLPDTVIVQSVSSPEKKYIYNYSSGGFRIGTLIEEKVNNDWKNSLSETAVYDNDGNKLVSLWKFWDNDSWVNSSKTTNNYSQNNLLSSLLETWEDNVWKYVELNNYTYNGTNEIVSHIRQIWSDTGWVNISKDIYAYDDNGNMINAIGMLWYADAWRNDKQYLLCYDENNNLILSLNQKWEDGFWNNLSKDTSIYNDANKVVTSVVKVWNDSVWENIYRLSYDYNGIDLLTTKEIELWQDDVWVNNKKYVFTYGAYNGIETAVVLNWDDDEWVNDNMQSYNYDEYGNSYTGNYYVWEGDIWTQNNEGALTILYDYCTKTESYLGYNVNSHYISLLVGEVYKRNMENNSISCYPNPARNYTYLRLKPAVSYNGDLSVDVYDLNGIKFAHMHKVKDRFENGGLETVYLNTEGLKEGFYLVRVRRGDKIETAKLIKIN
jgi:hypothetical protein